MNLEEKNIMECIDIANKRIEKFKSAEGRTFRDELFTQGSITFWEREKSYLESRLNCLKNKNILGAK